MVLSNPPVLIYQKENLLKLISMVLFGHFQIFFCTRKTKYETHYRQWLAYSLITDRVYCWTRRLYGTPMSQKNILSTIGCNDWYHLSICIKDYEPCKNHLKSEINRATYVSWNRVDLSLIISGNTRVSRNREIVKLLMDIIL